MDKYSPDSVHKRVDYVQHIYSNYPENFENFTLPIAAYDRGGVIAGANRIFRSLTGSPGNLYGCLDDPALADAARAAFDGGEHVYRGAGRLLRTSAGKAAQYQLGQYPNAIFFPMAQGLAGILLDENKPD